MNQQQENQLLQGGECYLHFHPEDRVPTHDTLNHLQALAAPQIVSANKTLSYENDYIECSITCTITLPRSIAGKEFEIINVGTGIITILPTSPDTVQRTTSVISNLQGMALRFKAVIGGWVLI